MKPSFKKWKVIMSTKAESEFKTSLRLKLITSQDLQVLKTWLFQMEEFGPQAIANSSEWHDHPLEGPWKGFRSSAFSSKGRIIYRVLDRTIVVEVHRVTPRHDYQR